MRLTRLRRTARAFALDGRGFAAVEFALVLPVLLLFALGVTEVGRFVLLGIKVQHAADTMADLAAGTSRLTEAHLTDMFNSVRHVTAPFHLAAHCRAIVSGVARAGEATTVLWQRQGAGGLVAVSTIGAGGGNAVLPGSLALRDGETVIVAEVFFRYEGSLLDLIPATTIRRVAFYRPRFGMSATL